MKIRALIGFWLVLLLGLAMCGATMPDIGLSSHRGKMNVGLKTSVGNGGGGNISENLLPQSEDFELSWTASEAAIVPDSTRSAPTRYAQLWQASGVNAAHTLRYDSWPLADQFKTPEDAVFSCYVRKSNTQYVKLGLRNGTGTIHTTLWQNTGSGYVWVSDSAGITSHGQQALSGGWYRLWIHVNAVAEGLTIGTLENDPYIYVCSDGLRTGEGSYIWGAQYEVGRTKPGGYKRKGATVAAPGLAIALGTQNGDSATVSVSVALASAANVRLVGRVERSVNFVADVDTVQITTHATMRVHDQQAWDIGDRLYRTDKIIVDAKAVGGSIVQSDTFVVEIDNAPLTVAHDGYIAGFYAQDDLDDLDYDVPFSPEDGHYDLMNQFDLGVFPRQFAEDATTTDGDYVVYGKTDWYRQYNNDFIPLVYFYYFGYPPAWSNTSTYPTGTMARYQFDWMSNDDYILKYASAGGHAAGDTVFATWGSNTRALVRTNPAGFVVDSGDTTWHWQKMAEQLSDFYNHSSNMRDGTGWVSDYMNYPGYIDSEGAERAYIDMDNDGVAYGSDTQFLNWGVDEATAYDIVNARFWRYARELMPTALFVPNGKRSAPWAIASQVEDIDGKVLENWRIDGSAAYAKTWEMFKSLVTTYPDSLESPAWDGPFDLVLWDNRFPNEPNREVATEGPALIGGGVSLSSIEITSGTNIRAPKSLNSTRQSINLGTPTGEVVETKWGLCEREYENGRVVLRWGGDRKTPGGAGWAIIGSDGDTISQTAFYDMPDPNNASWVFSGFNDLTANYPFTLANYDLPRLGARRSATLNQGAPNTDYHRNSLFYVKNIGPWADKNGDMMIALLASGLDALSGAHVDSAKITMIVGFDGFDAAAGDTLFFVGMESSGLNGWLDVPSTTYNNINPGESWPVNWDSVTLGQLGGNYSFYAPSGTVSLVQDQTLTVDITEVAQAASDSDSWGGIAIIFKGTAGVNAFRSGALGSVQYAPWIEVWTSEP